MITTRQVRFESKELFKLFVIMYFKKRWWLFALLATIMVVELSRNSSDYFYVFIAVSLPIVVIIKCYSYAYSAQNNNMRVVRHHVINEEEINTYTTDGSTSQIKLGKFIKAERQGKYYLLYISKGQHMIFKKEEFESEQDWQWFQQHVFLRIQHKRV